MTLLRTCLYLFPVTQNSIFYFFSEQRLIYLNGPREGNKTARSGKDGKQDIPKFKEDVTEIVATLNNLAQVLDVAKSEDGKINQVTEETRVAILRKVGSFVGAEISALERRIEWLQTKHPYGKALVQNHKMIGAKNRGEPWEISYILENRDEWEEDYIKAKQSGLSMAEYLFRKMEGEL